MNYFIMKEFKKFVAFVLLFSFVSFNSSVLTVFAIDGETETAPETVVTPPVEEEITPLVEEEITPPVEEEIVVQEENKEEQNIIELTTPRPSQAKGTITVCKVILGPDGAPISSAPGSTFTVDNDFGSPAVFTTPMVINTKLFNGDHGNDANCIEYGDLSLNLFSKTTFHYEAEVTTGSSWEAPLYNESFNNVPHNLNLNNLSSFKEFSANEDYADGELSLYNIGSLKNRTLVIINKERTAQISAAKIICDSEADLPNWGSGGPDITGATAPDFLNSHPNCHSQPGWKYEWAVDGTANPGDNVEIGGGAWQVFDENNLPEVPVGSRVWVREQIPTGYIPFSTDTDGGNGWSDVSAEFYCSTDVLNYDNYDWIDVTESGIEYHCLAFNVQAEEPLQCNPQVNLIENGDFEAPVIAPGIATGWDIIADSNLLLKWLVAWANPQDGGRLGLEIQDNVAGAPFGGSQHAELDGDHPTTIWQNIDTIPGKEYSFSFKYSPRPGRNLADDSLQVKIDGSVLGSNIATDGTANGNTVWESITRTFVAIGATTKVEIYDNGTDTSFGGYVDNADLRCVGDPQEPCDEDASQVVVSNSSTQVDEHGALPLTFVHPAWTASIPGATWIWATDPVESPTNDADLTKTFTKTFTIVGTPTSGTLDIAADNNYSAKVNGNVVPVVFNQNNFQLATQDSYDVSAFLISGVNTIEIKVTNKEIGEDANPANNPAGLMYKLTVHNNECLESPRTARITVIKNTGSSVNNGTFHFTGLDGDDGFDLTTAVGTASSFFDVFADVDGESYTITEVVPQGWNLTSTYCEYDNESFGVAVENGKTVTVDPGDQITCTFTNQKQVIDQESYQCSDDSDNDQDGLNNQADPGCHTDGNVNNPSSYDPNDDSESNQSAICSDGLDNDQDGQIDSNDPGCQSGPEGSWNPNDTDENNSPTITPSGGGGGGNSSGNRPGGASTPLGQVLGAETSCGIYVDKFLRRGYKNDVEAVKKVQTFLNNYMKAGLPVTGYFGIQTEKALKKFQTAYPETVLGPWGFKKPTGIFYLTTQTQVNNIMCPELKLPIPALTPIETNPLAPKKA